MATGMIFDCDGTLIDSMNAWYVVENRILASGGIEPSEAITAEIAPLTIPEVGVLLHGKYGIAESAEAAESLIHEGMLSYYRNEAEAREGALEFVQALYAAGVRCSVASSSPQVFLRAGLEHTGFMPYLDAVLSVDDVGASKREPAVYDEARRRMGTALENTWGVEDSLYAIHTLKKAGYRTIAIYDNDIAGPFEDLSATSDIAIRSFAELDPRKFI